MVTCPDCNGFGDGENFERCPTCGGEGEIETPDSHYEHALPGEWWCGVCKRGHKYDTPCPDVEGVPEEELD